MICKECISAVFAAKAPAVGDYYYCKFDGQPHTGNWECMADKKDDKSKELVSCRKLS
jgi:hypothetical protein